MPPVSKKDTPVSAMHAAPDVETAPDDTVTATGPELAPDSETAAPVANPGVTDGGDGESERELGSDAAPGEVAEVVVEDPRMERVDSEDDPATPVVPPFMSEGVRQDLMHTAEVLDPMSGGVFRRDTESGKISFTPKGGGETVDLS
jgi:hypothetical protein